MFGSWPARVTDYCDRLTVADPAYPDRPRIEFHSTLVTDIDVVAAEECVFIRLESAMTNTRATSPTARHDPVKCEEPRDTLSPADPVVGNPGCCTM